MSIHVSLDDRGVVTGATGTGKTTFVKVCLLPKVSKSKCVIVVDPKCDDAWKDIPDIAHNALTGWKFRAGITAYRFRKIDDKERDRGLGQSTDFLKFCQAVYKNGSVLLIIDETSALFPTHFSLTPIMGRLIREGRQKKIGIWWLTQRPSAIPMSIITESEWAAVFTLRYSADRKKMAQTFGDELERMPPQETGRSHCFRWARLPHKPKLWRLTLS